MSKNAAYVIFVLIGLLMSSCNREGTSADINGLVWVDENENGLRDSRERGLEGVRVELHDVIRGDMVTSEYTGLLGEYSFTVSPGEYKVRVVPSDQYTITLKDQTGGSCPEEACDSDVYPTGADKGLTDTITLEKDEINNLSDAGLVPREYGTVVDDLTSETETTDEAETLVIEGTVWLDANDDGLQDLGEAGVEGVRVELIYGDPTMDTFSKVQASDENGNYRFELLPKDAKDFIDQDGVVAFTPPEMHGFAWEDIGSDDTIDSDVGEDGSTEVFPLVGGETRDYDAGLIIVPAACIFVDPQDDCTGFYGGDAACNPGIDIENVMMERGKPLKIDFYVFNPDAAAPQAVTLNLDLDRDPTTGMKQEIFPGMGMELGFGISSQDVEVAQFNPAGKYIPDVDYEANASTLDNGIRIEIWRTDDPDSSCDAQSVNPLCQVNFRISLCGSSSCDRIPNEGVHSFSAHNVRCE